MLAFALGMYLPIPINLPVLLGEVLGLIIGKTGGREEVRKARGGAGSADCLGVSAAGCSRGAAVQESLVQVWSEPSAGMDATSISSGVLVGDGLHVLTLMAFVDYVRCKPGPVQVVAGGKRYDASIEGFDSNTGFTLLRLQIALTAAAVGQVTGENETILTWEWNGSRWTVSNRMRTTTIPGRPSDHSFFYITSGDPLSGPVLSAGTVVTDRDGKVLGLAEPLGDSIYLAVPPPEVAKIGVGMELLNSGN